MANILLTGARAPATLELARLFNTAGHRVFTAESLPVSLCARSRAVSASCRVPPPRFQPGAFVAALCALAERHTIDLIIPTCEEAFYVACGHARLSRVAGLFTEPLARLRPLHSKWAFNQLAAGMGLDVPPTRLLDGPPPLGEPVVLKADYSRFAEDVVVCPQSRADVRKVDYTARRWLVQRYIRGRQVCTYSVAHAGHLAAHGAYYTDFTAGNGSTIAFEPANHPAALAWVRAFVEGYGYTGQIAFDFIERPDGSVTALECNPRATSGVHLFDDRLAGAFFPPGDGQALVTPPPGRCSAVTAALWVYGWQGAPGLGQWLRAALTSRDVIWQADDPRPTLDQLRLLVYLMRHRHGRSLMGASTYDIEWNGEDIPCSTHL